MKRTSKLLLTAAWALLLLLAGCSKAPSGSLIDAEFDAVKANVKTFLGADYEAAGFSIKEQKFKDEKEDTYLVSFTFNLNKPFLVSDGKNLPGELVFEKNENGEWACTLNTGNPKNIFNLLSK